MTRPTKDQILAAFASLEAKGRIVKMRDENGNLVYRDGEQVYVIVH